MIDDDKIRPNVRETINESIEKTLDVWISGVQLALGEFDAIDHLPNRFLLCGGGSSLNALVDRLETSNWYRELPFARRPTIKHIRPEDVVGIVDETGDVTDHTMITALGLLRVGYDTMETTTGTSETLRDKLDKILRI